MGYHLAGFEVVGIDIKPQPRYPFEFHQADALSYPLEGFDAYHASPPCKADNQAVLCRPERDILRAIYPRLITPTRERLLITGKPFVIENVPLARKQLREPIMLCGTMFGLKVRRHRYFELNGFDIWFLPASCACKGKDGFTNVSSGFSSFSNGAKLISVAGHNFSVDDARVSMAITWLGQKDLSQAIPWAFTQYIGNFLIKALHPSPNGEPLSSPAKAGVSSGVTIVKEVQAMTDHKKVCWNCGSKAVFPIETWYECQDCGTTYVPQIKLAPSPVTKVDAETGGAPRLGFRTRYRPSGAARRTTSAAIKAKG